MELLRKHIGVILYSGFVANKPRDLSTLILAHPERGKSTEAKRFQAIGAIELQDLSSWGVLHMLRRMSPKERGMFHHIIVPDLEKLASRSKRLKEELLSTIRILSEEGFVRSMVRTQMFHFKKRVTVGFVLCTTPEDIGDRRSALRSYSLLSRFIPFTFDFSSQMKIDVLRFVENEDNIVEKKIWLKREEKAIVLCAPPYKRELDPYVSCIASEIDRFSRQSSIRSLKNRERKFGVRLKENLITYLKAIALYDGYEYVRRKHLDSFKELFHFMNFQFDYIDKPSLTTPFIVKQSSRLKSSLTSPFPVKRTPIPCMLHDSLEFFLL